MLAAWALVLVLCAAAYPTLQRSLSAPDLAITGSQSARVEGLLERRFPSLGAENDALVFYSSRHIASDHTYRAVLAMVLGAVRDQQHVRGVLGPYDPNAQGQIAAGEHAAVALVALGGNAVQRFDAVRLIQEAATRAARGSGVHAWLTGYSPIAGDINNAYKVDGAQAEKIGLPVAFVILLLSLGALAASMVPLSFAIAGLLLTYGLLTALSAVFRFDSSLVAMVTMLGLGIGIDYSLFIVSRFRNELAFERPEARGESGRVADAVGIALATSGRTILFSGAIVALSLVSMLVVHSPVFVEVAVGAVLVVTCMLAAAMTLLPALLASLGSGINRGALPARMRPATLRPAGDGQRGGWARWALWVMRHPVPVASVAVVALVLAATPVFHLRFGFNLGIQQLSHTPSKEGEKVLAQSFSSGALAPIEVIVTGRGGRADAGSVAAAARSLEQKLESDPTVTGVAEKRGEAGTLLEVVPSVPVDSLRATALVQHIRRDLAPSIEAHGGPVVLVGGTTAQTVDGSAELRSKFILVLALILGPSLLFLMLVFRSVVLPVKAVLMNLLATGATMGLVVLVFQDGHGHQLLDFTSTGYIQSSVPLIMFALLFGLSMDYEIFLIRRMREEWRQTGDNKLAVAAGIEHTARPITAAAAIMVAIFGSFVTADLLELKQLGFALAVAIALDATLIRLVLVPATMRLLGARNWWLPAWLARLLPRLEVD